MLLIPNLGPDLLRRYQESNGIETPLDFPVQPDLSQAHTHLALGQGDSATMEHLAGTELSLPIDPHLKGPCVDESFSQANFGYEVLG